QSNRRQQEAAVERTVDASTLEFRYAHPKLPYRCLISADGWRVARHGLDRRVGLAPRERLTSVIHVQPSDASGWIDDDQRDARHAHADQWRRRFTHVEADDTVFEAMFQANARDIASFPLLDGERDEWLAMQAGMPLYPAFFGRDAVTAGWQMAILDAGEALDAAMTRLGRMQSRVVDEWRDAEPGRIPYQVRTGPLALLDINPYSAYYADYASPLMFVISLANLYTWTG